MSTTIIELSIFFLLQKLAYLKSISEDVLNVVGLEDGEIIPSDINNLLPCPSLLPAVDGCRCTPLPS